ncbi:hypothetical protein YpE1979001_1746 [Yersinia pestis biovar Antiqua str. E1979001]|nr:hypothetical protein YpE1979001_1746 [Yersinia pestis biovar Antiqua str. E1979001]
MPSKSSGKRHSRRNANGLPGVNTYFIFRYSSYLELQAVNEQQISQEPYLG